MHIGRLVSGIAGLALVIVSSHGLLAQDNSPILRPGNGTAMGPGAGAFGGRGMKVTTGAPYTAIRKTTFVEKLANGTTINRVNLVKEARDSSGRTYREELPGTETGPGGRFRESHPVTVFDPVSHTSMHWNANSKEATVFHMPDRGQGWREHAPATGSEELGRARANWGNRVQPQPELLGTKTVGGVEAEGTRMTRVIPVGAEGNDQAISITHEIWTSSELKTAVLSTSVDPRGGTTTTELTEIQRGEPDPALFQPPAGYAVKERTGFRAGRME